MSGTILNDAGLAVKDAAPVAQVSRGATATAVMAKAHGANAVAWEQDGRGEWGATATSLAEAGAAAWAPAARFVMTARVPTGDALALEVLATHAARAGVRVLGVRDAADGVVCFLFAGVLGLARTALSRAEGELSEARVRGTRPASGVVTLALPPGEPVPALVPDAAGRYLELIADPTDGARWVSVSATTALAATRRPPVATGSEPTPGRWRPARDVRAVLEELIDPFPRFGEHPWMLTAGDGGGVAPVPLSAKIQRRPGAFLLSRGIPSLHALRACFLAVDGDDPLAAQAAVEVNGGPVVGAFSGSLREVRGEVFRALRIVLPVAPSEREAVADAIEDRVGELYAAAGLPTPERHHARPGQMDRLPCTPSAKPGAAPGPGFLLIHGPAEVEAIDAATARHLLHAGEAGGVEVRLGRTPTATAEPKPAVRRALGLDAGEWLAGMGAATRALLEMDLYTLAEHFPDSQHPRDRAAMQVLSSVYRRGGGPGDGLEVLNNASGALGGWLESKAGRGRPAQLHRLERELERFFARNEPDVRGVGTARTGVAVQRREIAERLWAGVPADASWEAELALAVLLDTLARAGRPMDPMTWVVDLGERELTEQARVRLATLTAGVGLLGGAVEVAATGGRSTRGERIQTAWAFHVDLAPAEVPGRPTLAAFTATFIESRLAFVKRVAGTAARALLALRVAARPLTNAELRGLLGVGTSTLTPALAVLHDLRLAHRRMEGGDRLNRPRWTVGPATPAGVAARHGGLEEQERRVAAHLAEREAEAAAHDPDDESLETSMEVPITKEPRLQAAATAAAALIGPVTDRRRPLSVPTQRRCAEAAPEDSALGAMAALTSALAGFVDSLWQHPGRCPGCGWHPVKQGHAADCPKHVGGASPMMRQERPVPPAGSTCSECGERLSDPSPLQRCRVRHTPSRTLAELIDDLEQCTTRELAVAA